ALFDGVGWRVAEQLAGAGNIGLGMEHVAWTEGAAGGAEVAQQQAIRLQSAAEEFEKFVEGGAGVQSDVVNLVGGGVGGGGGEEICLDSVGDVTEITAGGTVAINLDGLAAEHGANPLGNHGGIGAVGVLAGAKDIEVAEAHALQAVGASENAGVEFVDGLGHGVRGKRASGFGFHFGEGGIVAIDRAAGGVDESADFGGAGGGQDIEKAGDIGGVGAEGIFNGAGNGTEGGLMEDIIGAFARAAAEVEIEEIALEKGEARPLIGLHEALDFIEVCLFAGG